MVLHQLHQQLNDNGRGDYKLMLMILLMDMTIATNIVTGKQRNKSKSKRKKERKKETNKKPNNQPTSLPNGTKMRGVEGEGAKKMTDRDNNTEN